MHKAPAVAMHGEAWNYRKLFCIAVFKEQLCETEICHVKFRKDRL